MTRPDPGATPHDAAGDRLAGLGAEARRLLDVAARHLGRSDATAAIPVLRGALALAPDHPELLRLWGIACVQEGRASDAVTSFRRAIAKRPGDALLHNNLGSALHAAGDTASAIEAFRQACALAPGLAAAWYNLGKTLKLAMRTRDADAALRRALELEPRHATAWRVHGDNLKALGRIEQSARAYRRALELDPAAALAWWGLANIKTLALQPSDADHLQALAARADIDGADHALIHFALAKALEDQQRWDEAWQVYATANAIRRRQQPWNAPDFSRHVDAIREAFAMPGPVAAADQDLGSQVIFVVSLPRSGSTLVEQVLAAHPAVEGAGELPVLPALIAEESRKRGRAYPDWIGELDGEDWTRLGHAYLERTATWRERKPRHADKGLDNWLYLGAAATMLPRARFIHCTREPLETALSCWRQWFNAGQRFSYDLEAIAAFLDDHARAMGAWHSRWPERIFEQALEHLQLEPERNIRALLAALDLDFDAACLAPHAAGRDVRTASAAQVRQPLQRTTRRAHAYGRNLDELRRLIASPP